MEQVLLERENHIGVLSINRPESLNALSRAVVDEIDKLIDFVSMDDDIKVLIIYSKGNFAAGADIGEMVDFNTEEAKKFSFSSTFNKIANLGIPTIAVIDGFALGGGLELALACDLRIATTEAKMGFPEIGLGIMPGAGGTIRAPRLLGEAKSKELIFLGSIITADEALKIGLINVVKDKKEIESFALKWAEKLEKTAATALAMAKRTIEKGLEEPNQEKAIDMEAENFAYLFSTVEQKERMQAFLKRKAEKKSE